MGAGVALPAAFGGVAGAAITTVGPKLSSFTVKGPIECEDVAGCTVSPKTPSYTSPVNGTIVGWRVKGAAGALTLRVLDGNSSSATTATAFGFAEPGSMAFTASVPIKSGERFAIDLPHESSGTVKLGYGESSTSAFAFWAPKLGTSETRAPKEVKEAELLANVEIRPRPGITAVTPSTGTVLRSNPVTITGHDLEDASTVEFGGTPASIEENTDSKIVVGAVGFTPGTVSVKVTTAGGSATAASAFTFEPESTQPPPGPTPISGIPPIVIPPDLAFPEEVFCHVPKLRGKTLKAAKRELAAAHCALGSVTKRKGIKAKHGKVVGQVPAAGSPPVPAGSHVQIRLG